MQMSIDVDTKGFFRWTDKLSKQMPFAVSLALNRTAEEFQAVERKQLHKSFTIRRKTFIERQVKIERRDRATKDKFSVRVAIDQRRDFLSKFESDRVKRPRSGRALAVPIEVRRGKTGVIPKGQRLEAFNLKRVGGRVIGDKRTFVVPLNRGKTTGLLLQRVGRRSRSRLKTLYVFKRSVPLPASLNFEKNAERTATKRWEPNMLRAFDAALRTAK